MNHRMIVIVALVLALISAAVLPAAPVLAGPLVQDATPTAAEEEKTADADAQAMEEVLELVTATAHADLVRPGRVLISARGNHWIYDSVPPLDGPNEEVNPLDGMLGALLSSGLTSSFGPASTSMKRLH